jgi:predicted GIY-YIG superfamily endonuclease
MDTGWLVYVLECADRTLYVGVTNDLSKRLKAHREGKGARYTRGRAPLVVRYTEAAAGRGAALAREAAIRKLSRERKLALIQDRDATFRG